MPEEQELKVVVSLDDRASAGLASLQRTMREFGGGPQAANMERFRRQTREGTEGMEQLGGSMRSAAVVAGVIGGAVGAVGLKIIDMGVSAIANIANINAYAEAMRNLQQRSYSAGESAAQFKANMDTLKTAGISEQDATRQLTGFMAIQEDLMQTNSATMRRILTETPRQLHGPMIEQLRIAAVEPTAEALNRISDLSQQIREGAAQNVRDQAASSARAAGLSREEIERHLADIEPAAQRAGAGAQRAWLQMFSAEALAHVKGRFSELTEAQREAIDRQIAQGARLADATDRIGRSWTSIKTAVTAAIVEAGLVELMETIAGWTDRIAADINDWSRGLREPEWIKTIADTVKQIRDLIEWMDRLAVVLQKPMEFARGQARGETFEQTRARVLEEQQAEQATRAQQIETGQIRKFGGPLGGGVVAGSVAEAGLQAIGVLQPQGEAGAIERAAPRPESFLQRINPFAAANVARERVATGRETPEAARARYEQRIGVALAPAIPATAPAPMAAPVPAVAPEEDRVLGQNTEATEASTAALQQLTGTLQTQMGGLEGGLGAGVAEMGPPAVAPAPAPAAELTPAAAWFGEQTIEARQAGGPVSSGKPYLVGERGPELFVPGGRGDVVPGANLAQGAPEPDLGPSASGRAQQVVTDKQFARLLQTFQPYGGIASAAASGLGMTARAGWVRGATEQIGAAAPTSEMTPGMIGRSLVQALQGVVGGGEGAQLDGGRGGAETIDSAASYLDRAAAQNVNVNGTGKISVDVRAPPGTHVSAQGEGLFKTTEIIRQTQMLPAESGAAAATGIGSATGVMTNGTA